MQLNLTQKELLQMAASVQALALQAETPLRICKMHGTIEVWDSEKKLVTMKPHGPVQNDDDWFINGITDACGPQVRTPFTR